jgi:Ca2+-binding RTX toxin-like protein
MIHRNLLSLVYIMMAGLILFSATLAMTANNIVPITYLTDQARIITASELAPSECDSIRSSLTAIHRCWGGSCNGTNANELIFGTAGYDEIDGKNGNDCIIGGGGDDNLNGGNDDDVLIGGEGNDTLSGDKKKDMDICYGGSGMNTFIECDLTP